MHVYLALPLSSSRHAVDVKPIMCFQPRCCCAGHAVSLVITTRGFDTECDATMVSFALGTTAGEALVEELLQSVRTIYWAFHVRRDL